MDLERGADAVMMRAGESAQCTVQPHTTVFITGKRLKKAEKALLD